MTHTHRHAQRVGHARDLEHRRRLPAAHRAHLRRVASGRRVQGRVHFRPGARPGPRRGLLRPNELGLGFKVLHGRASCVVQMEPEPMPTRSASAPASASRRACAPVTTLPATTSRPGCARFRCASISSWYTESPAAAGTS